MWMRRSGSVLQKAAAASPAAGGAPTSIPARVRSLQGAAAYLRHAPPSLYVTMDLPSSAAGRTEDAERPPMRHRTRLLDSAGTIHCAATTEGTLQTHGVYLLSSTDRDDVRFEKTEAIRSVLVGLPRVRSAAEASDFVAAHADSLRQVRAVLLPEIGCSGAGHAVRALVAACPGVVFVGSAFSRAFLSDPTFFDGVRRTVLANELVRADAVPFAELAADAFQLAEDGAEVDAAAAGARRVTAYAVHDAHRDARMRKARRTQPPHFHNQRIWYYDTALDALHVGAALCRLPWLPHVIAEAGRDVVLPAPPLMAAQRVAEGAAHPLLATWRPTEAAESLQAVLRRVPMVQRVMCEVFGEPTTTDPEGVALAVAGAAHQLEALRSRLSTRLETDTARDVGKWRRLLLERVVGEVASVNTASPPTDSATRAAFIDWALAEGNPLAAVATALTQSAIALPPTTAATPPPQTVAQRTGDVGAGGRPEPMTAAGRGELEGPSGVALMQDLLAKKGLGGLGGLIRKEEIDVSVFLAMTPDDFRRVLKATFGISKRLELLQQELRDKL